MNMIWIIILVSSCGIFKSNNCEEFIEHYQVSSPILTKLVGTTIDSCQSRIRCEVIEYMIIKMASKHSIRIGTLRKPVHQHSRIFKKDTSQAISFYVGQTLCFADKKELFSSGHFFDIKKLDPIKLSDLSFEYSCLDLEAKGEIYNVLIDFSYYTKNGEVILENHSIFIDSGDVDISETLKKHGISGQ